jgi:biotin transport system substrate-specific component
LGSKKAKFEYKEEEMYKVKELDYFRKAGDFVFKWSRNLTIARKILLAVTIACVTGLGAQFKIPLPWTPVPITMQTFFVLVAGVLLGRKWGGVSQIIYVSFGILGIPWFAGSSIFGPTGGYLIGFILAAFFLGYATDKYTGKKSFAYIFSLMFFASFFLIYIPGLIQLGFYFYLIKGSFPGFASILSMGLLPFIPGALIKIVLAALVSYNMLPRKTT